MLLLLALLPVSQSSSSSLRFRRIGRCYNSNSSSCWRSSFCSELWTRLPCVITISWLVSDAALPEELCRLWWFVVAPAALELGR
uniref:Putative secreted protein n=1 Tax=Anopheles marajoara TaxID=58244 RepID=A0A2M4CB10_9DIPT